MAEKSINQVVAEALRYYMGTRWNMSTLGARAGLAANTVKNYLNPTLREHGASGKEPSAKLTELDRMAKALGVQVADLVTDATDEERGALMRRRAGDYFAAHGRLPDWAAEGETSGPSGKRPESVR